jgi:hypothetical protein
MKGFLNMTTHHDFPLKTKKEIETWLEFHSIENFFIHDNLVVDIHEGIFLERTKLKALPFQFGIIDGSFAIFDNELTSLLGSPHTVLGSFVAKNNQLTILEYAPQLVQEGFLVGENQLTNLDFIPSKIGGLLDFSLNPIKNILDYKLDFQKIMHVAKTEEEKLIGFQKEYNKMKTPEGIIYFFEFEKEKFDAIQEKYQLEKEVFVSNALPAKKKL